MLSNQQFVNLLIRELHKQGYDCTHKNNEIAVEKNGFHVLDILGADKYRVYRNTINDYDYERIRSINESIIEAYNQYDKGEPLAKLPQYRKLCEFDDYVIAAKIMSLGYMEFVTWQHDKEKTRVDVGHYFTDYESAKEDFAIRCGLIDRHKMFNEVEMKLIHQGLVHLGANFPNLTAEQMTVMGKVIEKIEMLVPEIQEHEELEHNELVPDDGLEV